MRTLINWTPPVVLSLLLHVVVIVLVSYQLSGGNPPIRRVQTINVELLGLTTTSNNSPQPHKKVPPAKPSQEPPKPEPLTVQELIPQEASTPPPSTEQPSEAAQASSSHATSQQPGLTIQPLSKLTRPPAFLHKIEPVYPVAEQRAGTQASVLAEVTIDDKGNVLGVRIIKSAGQHFDAAVIEALQKSLFVPGYINKEAVAVRVIVPFRFNLR